jgi:selenocysteine-specific elongation factor
MEPLIIGTAGHIDHGKTLLIKALTGIDTDRLEEEKRRGITIDLGFAYLDLPSGQRVGIVDVPGHERFVRTMVAGATGIDYVLFTVAADEGVKPQTIEHLDILQLLQLKHGCVVITKKDLVDEDLLAVVREEVGQLVVGTFLESGPVIAVSALTGEGLEELKATLSRELEHILREVRGPFFRLPIDRVFTIHGFGCVVTGSVISGEAAVGDDVEIFPSGRRAKVRGLQSHNETLERVIAGQRAAVNLAGIKLQEVERGHELAPPGALTPAPFLDVTFSYLKSNSKALRLPITVHFHRGTMETTGRLVPLEHDVVEPGEQTLVQLRFGEPVVAMRGDRYIVRLPAPVRTIGGGEVLRISQKKISRFKAKQVEELRALKGGPSPEVALSLLRKQQWTAVTPELLQRLLAVDASQAASLYTQLEDTRALTRLRVESQSAVFLTAVVEEYEARVLEHLRQFHQSHPLEPGIDRTALKSALPGDVPLSLFNAILAKLKGASRVRIERTRVGLADFSISLSPVQQKMKEYIVNLYRTAQIAPPTLSDMKQRVHKEFTGEPVQTIENILMLLRDEGALVEISKELWYPADVVMKILRQLGERLRPQQRFAVAEFKKIFQFSRKFAIPLLEYLDAEGVTIRKNGERTFVCVEGLLTRLKKV